MKVKVGTTGKVIGVAILAIILYFVIAPKLKKPQVVETTKDSIAIAVDSGKKMQDSMQMEIPVKKIVEPKVHTKKTVIKKETIKKNTETKVDGSRENLELN